MIDIERVPGDQLVGDAAAEQRHVLCRPRRRAREFGGSDEFLLELVLEPFAIDAGVERQIRARVLLRPGLTGGGDRPSGLVGLRIERGMVDGVVVSDPVIDPLLPLRRFDAVLIQHLFATVARAVEERRQRTQVGNVVVAHVRFGHVGDIERLQMLLPRRDVIDIQRIGGMPGVGLVAVIQRHAVGRALDMLRRHVLFRPVVAHELDRRFVEREACPRVRRIPGPVAKFGAVLGQLVLIPVRQHHLLAVFQAFVDQTAHCRLLVVTTGSLRDAFLSKRTSRRCS